METSNHPCGTGDIFFNADTHSYVNAQFLGIADLNPKAQKDFFFSKKLSV
jgi:hypothetical protein